MISNKIIKNHRRTSQYYTRNLGYLNRFFIILLILFILLTQPLYSHFLAQGGQTSPKSRPTFFINEIITFTDEQETNEFYSGDNLTAKCKVYHYEGISKIKDANITIVYAEKNTTIIDKKEMILEATSSNWKLFRFNYTFPFPAQLGRYNVTVIATSPTSNPSEDKFSITINVINSLPEILGTIEPIYKTEEDQPWTLDLTNNKSDFEDSNAELTWHIENVNDSLVSVEVDDNNLTFTLLPNASGKNELKLILEDADQGRTILPFWLIVAPVNDPPVLNQRIPNIEVAEDSLPYIFGLTQYIFDVEDTNANKLLTWQVEGVDTSIVDIEIISDSISNYLEITPKPDIFGSNLITVVAIDSDGSSVDQKLWVNVTAVDDPPVWETIPDLYLDRQVNIGVLSLLDSISDIDTSLDQLTFEVKSASPQSVICNINQEGKLDISVNDPVYIGPGYIDVAASDAINEVSTRINLTIFIPTFTVHLLAPENSSIITTTSPEFHWTIEKPPNLGPIYYDFYLADESELEKFISRDPSARKARKLSETTYLYYRELNDNQQYYWLIVPYFIDENNKEYFGEVTEKMRYFRINLNSINQKPFTVLLTPRNQEVITEQSVNLTWLGYDADFDEPITYELYISTDKQAVTYYHEGVRTDLLNSSDSFFEIHNLKDNEIYFWTVIPTAAGQQGKCLTPVGAFAIDLYNTAPITRLLLPKTDLTVQNPPILYWDYIDPDPFENLFFDIYLSDDETRVESLDPQTRLATVQDVSNYYLPSLKTNQTYYWTVIPSDKKRTGICECGVWNFIINQSIINHPPTTQLISPENNAVVYKNSIELFWNGSDIDGNKITYTVYFGDDYNSVSDLDKSSKHNIVSTTAYRITNLTHGRRYYWTVIPDDSKTSGVCLDRIWSFEVNLEKDQDEKKDEESNRMLMAVQIMGAFIILIIIVGILAWVTRKRRMERKLKKYLKTTSDPSLPDDLRDGLLSTSTIRALHLDMGIEPKRGELGESETQAAKEEEPETSETIEDVADSEFKPYDEGEYAPSSKRLRYKPGETKLAEQVKRAIPYATGPNNQTNIASRSDIQLAKPLSKKVITKKPFKVSTLPVTRECPNCGSFKVKTYKDDTNKCLECKFKF